MALTVASSNKTDLSYWKQPGFGDTTGISTASTQLRFTSETFAAEQSTEISDELTGDPQVSDSVRTDFQVGGGMNIEWSMDSYDDLIEGVIMGDEGISAFDGDKVTIVGAVTPNATNGTFTAATSMSAITVGNWVLVTGHTDDTFNGWYKVDAFSDPTLTIDNGATSNRWLESGLSGAQATFTAAIYEASNTATTGDLAKNEDTLSFFYIERDFNEGFASNGDFTKWSDMCPQQWNLTVPVSGKITGSFTFVGAQEIRGTAEQFSAAATGFSTSILNSISNVTEILVVEDPGAAGEVYRSLEASAFDMTINNNVQRNQVIGTFGAAAMTVGSLECSGNITAYFTAQSPDRINDFLQQERMSIGIGFVDESDATNMKGMHFFFPAAKLSRAVSPNAGRNQSIFEELSWNAFKEGAATTDRTVEVRKINTAF